jgi:hypothetical protein
MVFAPFDPPYLGLCAPSCVPRLEPPTLDRRWSSELHPPARDAPFAAARTASAFGGFGLGILTQHEYITRSLLVGLASITERSSRRCLLFEQD